MCQQRAEEFLQREPDTGLGVGVGVGRGRWAGGPKDNGMRQSG